MKCENCGKEHDGSYGSGRFCSDHCRRVYSGKRVNVNGKQKCNFNATKHRAPYGTWKCKFCNQILLTQKSLFNHIWENHRPKYGPHGKGQKIWNKGLTNLPPMSKETKDKIVSTYIRNRKANKYRGTYKGIYFQYSFELAWIVWNLEHGIIFYRCNESFQYWDSKLQKERMYYPDFVLEDGTIVEIKGRVVSNTLDKQKAMIEIYHKKYLLLTQDKIQHCLDYCKEKYGNDFVQKLKDM